MDGQLTLKRTATVSGASNPHSDFDTIPDHFGFWASRAIRTTDFCKKESACDIVSCKQALRWYQAMRSLLTRLYETSAIVRFSFRMQINFSRQPYVKHEL